MARIRTIKPELPSDTALARCSRDARLTFVYLVTQSDDYGYIPAAPRQLVGLLYPHDDGVSPRQVAQWINELVEVGLCAWAWTREGSPLVALLGWEKHQRIDNRRKAVLSASLDPEKHGPPEFAAIRRENPRTAATREIAPLEPPTSDLRPPTSDLGAPTSDLQLLAPTRKKRESGAPPSWLTPAFEVWEAENEPGSWPGFGQAARELSPLYKAGHSPEKIAAHLRIYLRARGDVNWHRRDDETRVGSPSWVPSLKAFRITFGKWAPTERRAA